MIWESPQETHQPPGEKGLGQGQSGTCSCRGLGVNQSGVLPGGSGRACLAAMGRHSATGLPPCLSLCIFLGDQLLGGPTPPFSEVLQT